MEAKVERQKINRIKAVLAETGHTGKWLAEQLSKDPVTISKMVHQHHTTRFADAGKDFGIAKD